MCTNEKSCTVDTHNQPAWLPAKWQLSSEIAGVHQSGWAIVWDLLILMSNIASSTYATLTWQRERNAYKKAFWMRHATFAGISITCRAFADGGAAELMEKIVAVKIQPLRGVVQNIRFIVNNIYIYKHWSANCLLILPRNGDATLWGCVLLKPSAYDSLVT